MRSNGEEDAAFAFEELSIYEPVLGKTKWFNFKQEGQKSPANQVLSTDWGEKAKKNVMQRE